MNWDTRLIDIAAKTRYPIGDGDHGQIKPEFYRNEGIPYIRVADIDWNGSIIFQNMVYITKEVNDANPKSHLFPGDIIISKTGATIGKVAVIPDTIALANTTASVGKLTVNKEIAFPRFVFYCMSSKRFQDQLWKVSFKSAQPGFNVKDLKEFKIPLPPLKTQKKIAAILDKADELRQNDKKILEKYDQLAQSIFLEMFGDIDSNQKYKIITVGEVVTEVKDGPHMSPNYENEGIPILSTRNIRPFELDLTDMKYVSVDTFGELTKRFKPQRNDVLLTKGGTTGYAKLVNWDWEFCIWVHIAALRPDLKLINPRYLEAALNTYYCYRQSQKYTHGIANKDLGLKRLVNIRFPLPPIKDQDQFTVIFESINQQKEMSRQSLSMSETLFQSLLQRAFNGELD